MSPLDPDAELVRAARRRMGVRVGLVSGALVLAGAVLVAAFLWWKIHIDADGAVLPGGHLSIVLDPVDIAVAVVIVGIGATLGGGCVGAILAGRAVAPLADSLARQRRFVADASHELRTPLAVLSARTQSLARALHDDEHVAAVHGSNLREVQVDVQDLVRIVNEMLAAEHHPAAPAGPITQHPDAPPAPADLRDIITEVIDDLAPLAADLGVHVRGHHDLDAAVLLPAPSSASALRRCLFTLLDNALTHTPPGGHVDITCGENARALTISVRDSGAGLQGITAETVFDRFARGTPPRFDNRAPRESHGLGLSIVRQVMHDLGGSVRLDATGPDGTTFTLVLPEVGPTARPPQATS